MLLLDAYLLTYQFLRLFLHFFETLLLLELLLIVLFCLLNVVHKKLRHVLVCNIIENLR